MIAMHDDSLRSLFFFLLKIDGSTLEGASLETAEPTLKTWILVMMNPAVQL
jgi:bisphosphoglycerate-dependent phosphoglycerate mutase